MSEVTLADGRLLVGSYEFENDWWVLRVDGGDRTGESHWTHGAMRELFDFHEKGANPQWMIDAANRLAEHHTPLGIRVMCRCCGYLTLEKYGWYEICPVCKWEDDPTTTFTPGEKFPGPNHISLTEGRQNFAREGISKVRPRRVPYTTPPRAPLPEEHP